MADIAKPMPGEDAATDAPGILVVDDEPDVREVLVEHLRHRRQGVVDCSDGEAAVAAIGREPHRFGLVITDLQLPGIDGLGVLRAARRANPSCAVVIITGYASLDSAIQAVRLGAYDYLTKPFSLGQIDVLLRRWQERVALETENRRLIRRLEQRDGARPVPELTERLDAIESRLARIERVLLDRSGRHPLGS